MTMYRMQADANNCNYTILPVLLFLIQTNKQSLVELCSHEGTIMPKHVIESIAQFILSTFA